MNLVVILLAIFPVVSIATFVLDLGLLPIGFYHGSKEQSTKLASGARRSFKDDARYSVPYSTIA